jgi:hypothetical protein
MKEAVPGTDQGLEYELLYGRRVAALRQVQRLFHAENVVCP